METWGFHFDLFDPGRIFGFRVDRYYRVEDDTGGAGLIMGNLIVSPFQEAVHFSLIGVPRWML
jgi:hypothetical protein